MAVVVLGRVPAALILIAAITGFLSHSAYDPDLGKNAITGAPGGGFDLYFFQWPSSPAWIYVVTQGLHVIAGLAAIPVLLAKLWSVIPKLFEWPPVRGRAQPGAALARAAGWGLAVRLLHGRAQHPALLPVGVLVRARALLWRVRLPGGARSAHRPEARRGAPGVRAHGGAAPAAQGPRRHPARARRARDHSTVGARPGDDLASRATGHRPGRGRPAAPARPAGPARQGRGHRSQRLPRQ